MSSLEARLSLLGPGNCEHSSGLRHGIDVINRVTLGEQLEEQVDSMMIAALRAEAVFASLGIRGEDAEGAFAQGAIFDSGRLTIRGHDRRDMSRRARLRKAAGPERCAHAILVVAVYASHFVSCYILQCACQDYS